MCMQELVGHVAERLFEEALVTLLDRRAFMGLPEVNLGIIPGWGGTQRLTRLIGATKASEMLFTGRPIDAQEAYRVGLVNKVVPYDKLMATALEMAELVLKPAPLAVRAAKQAISEGQELPLNMGLELEKELFSHLTETGDFKEGCRAVNEKRKPKFEGK